MTEYQGNSKTQESKRALKGASKSFLVSRSAKTVIDGYVNQVKLHVKVLIESQLKEMKSTKAIMTLNLRWKKPVKLAITLNVTGENLNGAQDRGDGIGDNYIRLKMSFKSLIVEFFEVSNIKEPMQHVFTPIKM